MALLAAGSPLVAGSAALAMATQYVKVLRAFFHGREVLPVGAVVELPAWAAAEAVAANKAARVPKPAPVEEPVVAPAVEEPTAPAPKQKGKRHAPEQR